MQVAIVGCFCVAEDGLPVLYSAPVMGNQHILHNTSLGARILVRLLLRMACMRRMVMKEAAAPCCC